ncbi:MAG: hypothetical protein ACPGWR_12370 [Ardenticatenaceae bacterium]
MAHSPTDATLAWRTHLATLASRTHSWWDILDPESSSRGWESPTSALLHRIGIRQRFLGIRLRWTSVFL